MMATIIPKAKSGDWEIIHYDITEQEVQLQAMRGAFSGRGWMDRGLQAGTYCVLKNNASAFDSTVMSDTYLERITNINVVRGANGKVLIAGLGIGLILTAILVDTP